MEGVVALWRRVVATVGMSDTLCLSYVIVSVFPSLTLKGTALLACVLCLAWCRWSSSLVYLYDFPSCYQWSFLLVEPIVVLPDPSRALRPTKATGRTDMHEHCILWVRHRRSTASEI